jgi:hypothetical protein
LGQEGLEMSDFPLSELDVGQEALAALEKAGYSTFLEIIDLEAEDFRRIEEFPEEAVSKLVGIIDELTVLEDPGGNVVEESSIDRAVSTLVESEGPPLEVRGETSGDEHDSGGV